jgi:hypothetical protein
MPRLARLACLFSLLCAITGQAAVYPPESGTDRESDAYFAATERYLSTLDLNDDSIEFERLGGTTATNWAVKKDGKTVANLKCTSGNTNHHGAVIAYRLGREFGSRIYPVAVYRDVDRRIGDRQVSEQCALKEWDSVFTQYYWTRDTFASTDSADKRRLIAALDCRQPGPSAADEFRYYARSAYGDPGIPGTRRAPYVGTTSLLRAARDFSNMMVVDVLIGNEDRFPGGNLFFRSVTTAYSLADGTVTFDDARLFSLDNEAAFKARGPSSTHAARDLENHVSRFDQAMIEDLRALAADPARLAAISDGNEAVVAFIREGMGIVLERHAAAGRRCGEEMALFPE